MCLGLEGREVFDDCIGCISGLSQYIYRYIYIYLYIYIFTREEKVCVWDWREGKCLMTALGAFQVCIYIFIYILFLNDGNKINKTKHKQNIQNLQRIDT